MWTIAIFCALAVGVFIVLELARLWWIERHAELEWEDEGPDTWFEDHDDFKRIGR